MKKKTITKIAGRSYRYEKWYVYHNKSKGTTQRWCYLSKKYLELPEIKEGIQKEQATQNTTQTDTTPTYRTNNLNSRIIHRIDLENKVLFRARGLVRIRTLACGAGDPGFKSPRARHSWLLRRAIARRHTIFWAIRALSAVYFFFKLF